MIVTQTRFSLLKIEDENDFQNKNGQRQLPKTQVSKKPMSVAKKKMKNNNIMAIESNENIDFISKESQLITKNKLKERINKEEAFTLITKKRGIKKKNAVSLSQFISMDNNERDTKSMWTSEKPLTSLIPKSLNTPLNSKEALDKDNKLALGDGVPFCEILNLTRENAEVKAKLLLCAEEKAQSDRLCLDLQDKNSKLTILFENAQMKEKAELIIQIEELLTTHNDLSKEISDLNGELQREKSRTHQAELLVKSLQQQLDDLHQISSHSNTTLINNHHHQQSSATHHQNHELSSNTTLGSHKYQRGHIK